MIPRIKSTVIPIEFLKKFPHNDLDKIRGKEVIVINEKREIIKDGEELLFSTSSTPVCRDSGDVLV